MKSPTIAKCLSSLIAVSLILQSALPAAAQASVCSVGMCVYLPAVSRPPFLVVWHEPPIEGSKGAIAFISYIHNTSPFALKEINLRMERIDLVGSVVVSTHTLDSFGVSVLGEDELISFVVRTSRIVATYPIINVNLIVLNWKVALITESMPISLTSIVTNSFLTNGGRLGTQATFTFRNPYSQTLRDAALAVWYIDNTGQSTCTFLVCYDRRIVYFLLPNEAFSFTTQWEGGGYIPLEAIRVSAHGVISP